MTKQQARIAFLAGAGLPPHALVSRTPAHSLDRMLQHARFEEWWKYGTNFSRAKEGGK